MSNSRNADKFVLRLSDGLRDKIAANAKKSNQSMNSYLLSIIEFSINKVKPTSTYTLVPGMFMIYNDRIYTLEDCIIINNAIYVSLKLNSSKQNVIKVKLSDVTPIEL